MVVTRHRLADGYSDDVLLALADAAFTPPPTVIVLLEAGATGAIEARQISLGADSTLRDPVHADVLLAFLAKHRRPAQHRDGNTRRTIHHERVCFAGALLDRSSAHLICAGKSVSLTPRELQLIEVLLESNGDIVSYETLYSEILDSRFSGDTKTMRVLLARLARKADTIGAPFRKHLRVISKVGYRYTVLTPTPLVESDGA